MKTEEDRKAAGGRREMHARIRANATKAAPGRAHPQGRIEKLFQSCGWIRKLKAVIRASSVATTHHERLARATHRPSMGPSVLSATQSAPCRSKVAKAAKPTTTVYQSRMPRSPLIPKSVQSGRKK